MLGICFKVDRFYCFTYQIPHPLKLKTTAKNVSDTGNYYLPFEVQ
jgi:hypothetical protein